MLPIWRITKPRARCTWEVEPGEERWEFHRDGSDIAVKVYCDGDGESFVGEDDLLRFSGQVD